MASKLASRVGLDRIEDQEEELFVGLLMITGRFLRRLDETCRKWGITDDQYHVLRILRGSRPEGQPRFGIAKKLINRAPDVTRLLDRLEAKGLVIRSRNGPDRRQVITHITEEGLALLNSMSEDIAGAHLEVAQILTERERQVLGSVIRRLAVDDVPVHNP